MTDRRLTEEAEQESRKQLQQGSALEQTVAVGVGGPPELRRGERSAFLGQFPEQVLKAVTYRALSGKGIPGELLTAMADQRCQHVYLAADAVSKATQILRVIKQRSLSLTIVHSPEFHSETALVLTSDEPGQRDDIWVDKA